MGEEDEDDGGVGFFGLGGFEEVGEEGVEGGAEEVGGGAVPGVVEGVGGAGEVEEVVGDVLLG